MSELQLVNVSKNFDGVRAAEGVSFDCEKGNVTALIGANGVGKTTVFNLIGGFLKPDEGTLLYRGRDITGLAPWQIARLGIGRLFQDVRLFNRMTVLDNVLTAFTGQSGENALRAVFFRRRVNAEESAFTARARNLLKTIDLDERKHELAEELSYGQQKIMAIARLLAADADFLLLDEPTSGVTPSRIYQLLNFVRQLARDGKTVLLIEHSMSVVMEVADWVHFMDRGRIVVSGPPAAVLGNRHVRAAYLGL